jgi:hypothetical protein
MKLNKDNRFFIFLLIGWTAINLLQAGVTDLFDDEALFWLYGQRPAWGYFEHPPMVGMMIRAGYLLFPSEFGVRLVFVLINSLSVYLVAGMSRVEDRWLFPALVFTSIIAQVGGFIAAPDVALMFYTVLFFLLYRRLLEAPGFWLAVAWGAVMAAMIYSKYNGILVVIFTLFSNFRLIRKPFFWFAAATATVCMLPHILWSFANGHPTILYHLFERSFEQFNALTYLGQYLVGQLAIYGPFTGIFMIWAVVAYRPADEFEKSLKFTAVGFLLFFLAYTMRAKIEPNWTVPALPAMLILSYRYFANRISARKWILRIATVSLVLMLAFRIFLVYDYMGLPRHVVNMSELRGWKEWSLETKRRAAGRPVVFFNSYQRASKYIFYTGEPAYTMEDYAGHRTQFWYWDGIEKSLQGKDVMVVDFVKWRWLPAKKAYFTSNRIITYYGDWPDFRSHYKLELKFKMDKFRFPANANITLPVSIVNPYPDTVRFGENPMMPAWIVYHIHYRNHFIAEMVPSTDITKLVIPGGMVKDTSVRFITPSAPGNYYFWVSIGEGPLPPPRNMNVQAMEIY